jgi:hypothetical protein
MDEQWGNDAPHLEAMSGQLNKAFDFWLGEKNLIWPDRDCPTTREREKHE